MAKSRTNKLGIVIIIGILFVFLVPCMKIHAATTVPFTYPKHFYVEYKKGEEVYLPVTLKKGYEKYHYTEKYKKVKSSNKSVAEPYYSIEHASMNYYGPFFKIKKIGTAKVTFDAKIGSKTYHCSSTIHVSKYSAPIKKLELDGKNYLKKIKTGYYDCRAMTYSYDAKKDAKTVTVKVIPAANWSVVKIIDENGKKLSNGAKVKVINGYREVHVTLKNKKTKVQKELIVYLSND